MLLIEVLLGSSWLERGLTFCDQKLESSRRSQIMALIGRLVSNCTCLKQPLPHCPRAAGGSHSPSAKYEVRSTTYLKLKAS